MHTSLYTIPTLETERLVLRPLTRGDAADVFAYASDPEVARTTTWHPHRSIDDAREFIAWALHRYDLGHPEPFGIVLRATGRVIGTCGLTPTWAHRRGEIGYALARRYWGQGIMTEAVRAVIRHGFTTMDLNRIEARCMVDNVASERVMQKAGMTLEGTLREREICKGQTISLRLYAILRREWGAHVPISSPRGEEPSTG